MEIAVNNMKRIFITLLFTAAPLILLSNGIACSSQASSGTVSSQINGPPPTVDNLAPDFTVDDINGKTVELTNFRGKNVLLDFWSLDCDQCIMERDIFQAVHAEDPDIQIMMVDSKEDLNMVRQYVRSSNFTLPVFIDEGERAAGSYDVNLIPETFLINSAGTIKYIQDGAFASRTQLEDALRTLQ